MSEEPDDVIHVQIVAKDRNKVQPAEVENAIKQKLEKEPTDMGKFSREGSVIIVCRRR